MGNRAAARRSKTSKRRFSVYLLMNWYEHEINRGVSDYARQADWIFENASAHSGNIDREWTGDGIIVNGIRRKNDPNIRFIMNRKVPTVDMFYENKEIKLPRVLPDNHAIGKMAAEHFISRGFENLAYYQAFMGNVEQELMQGFFDTAVANRKSFYHVDFSKFPGLRGGKRIERLGKILSKLPKPVGIMGQYDYSAKELAYACEAAELPVPEQVAIIGVDNDPISCELGPIGITSVDSNLYRRGFEAAALLDKLMRGGKAPDEPIRIPPKGVVVRQSSDILAVKDLPLEKAMRYILINIRRNIKVEDLVAASGVSRTILYELFTTNLRKTPRAVIMAEKINKVKELLAETDEKLDFIASETGFPNGNRLCKVFAREVGIPPHAFRRNQKKEQNKRIRHIP